MCYIHSSLDTRFVSFIGCSAAQLELSLYSDADFAGDKATARSTAGVFAAVTGPNTLAAISAVSKRQSCVAHSAPEAELVAANHAVRVEGLPTAQLWSVILERTMKLTLREDNESAIRILKSGRNPTMRYTSRTQKHQLTLDA